MTINSKLSPETELWAGRDDLLKEVLSISILLESRNRITKTKSETDLLPSLSISVRIT